LFTQSSLGVVAEAPPLSGTVVFGDRAVQTTMGDVAKAATVSLINTGANRTEATTLTDDAGKFQLTFARGFKPDSTATYYIEAVKGLDSNRPGNDAVRVRTIAKYKSGGWVTLTNASPGGITIGRSTTALAIGAALKAGTPSSVDLETLIGAVAVGSPDVYRPVTNLTQADYESLYTLVDELLAADADPVAGIAYDVSGNTWQRLTQGGSSFSYTTISPSNGNAGDSVTLSGSGFSATLAENKVRFFDGVEAAVTSANPTSLVVTVPSGAASGQTTLQVGNLIALGPNFTIDVSVTGFTPTSGGAGTSVTIAGKGFGATPGENTVRFNGVEATVTSASPTSLVVTAPTSTTGPISVTAAGVTGTTSEDFTYGASGPSGSSLLLALSEPVMNAGTLKLEGSFGPTAQVNFPGGVSVPATVLGSNRAEVSVPAGATAGGLTVTSGGTTSGALPFRRTSFAPGLARFNARYDQPRQMPKLVTARANHASAVIGNHLYVVGGKNSSSTLSSVERAMIHADGTLGPFATVSGVNLVTARAFHTSVVIGDYLYVLGGNNSGFLNSVERAAINPDGTLGNFSTVAGVSLVTAQGYHTSTVIGSYLYVVGGWNNSDKVERAVINPDGTLGAFATVAGVRLVNGRYYHSSSVVGNYLYVMGGWDNGGELSSVERAAINPDGTLGNFSTVAGVSLGTARGHHTSTVIGNHLYVVGGETAWSNSLLKSVERATINADGTLGNFSTVAGVSLVTARGHHTSEMVGNYLYILGGYGLNGSSGSYVSSVERAAINPDGALGGLSTLASVSLATARTSVASTVIGNYLYVMGGANVGGYLTSVERAPINADGTLGTFTAVGTMTTPRSGLASAVIGNYLYILGGYNGVGLTSVERAPINSDGTLGAFTAVGTMTTPRQSHSCVVIDSYLYVLGGGNNSTSLNSVERAPINADGTLGAFTAVGTMTSVRSGLASVVIGNYLYALGGWDLDMEYGVSSVERALINSNGTIGAFAAVAGVSLNPSRDGFSIAVIGNNLYAVGGMSENDYLNSVERAAIGADGSIGAFTSAGTLVTPRTSHTSTVIGNYLYVLGGYNASNGMLSGIERAQLQ
jgi:N-acetylneuraminic acid mutarotase